MLNSSPLPQQEKAKKSLWRKWNRIIHRDLGYFFFGMLIIYGFSGIALNHLEDWDPSYKIDSWEVTHNLKVDSEISEAVVLQLLENQNLKDEYKSFYFPQAGMLKIFIKNGSVSVDLLSGKAQIETITKRPFFYQFNLLHYNNPKRLWTWFSDFFAGGMILLAISGLFILKGKNGLKKRGVWFVAAGIIIPAVLFYMYV